MDEFVSTSGGASLFGNDDGYVVAPLEVAKAGISRFKLGMRDRCGLQLQEYKTELFSNRELSEAELGGMKRAGVAVEGGFAPGFLCYGIPIGSSEYVSHMLEEKAQEVVRIDQE